MRRFATVLAFAAALMAAPAARADTAPAKTTYYDVSGDSGVALIKAMDKKGPRRGFMTRAIALTSYTVGWEFTWARENGACRLVRADGQLDMTYTFPKLSASAAPDLSRRWTRFMAGVRKHEEHHGKLAREMVTAAERSVRKIRFRKDPACTRAQSEAKQRIGAVYLKYEARQIDFDKREHADGGNVEHLLLALMKGDTTQ